LPLVKVDLPALGRKAIRDVTPDDIENIRDALTAAVLAYEAGGSVKLEGRLAPKSAQNVWASLTTPFKYASTRKGPRELRVREDRGNPCFGIPPPRDGSSKHRHWCRPGEIVAVLESAAVPQEWREAIAIGCYLHLRPGELHELRVADLDLDTGEVRICRAFDERENVVKAPKTSEGIRHVTVPPTELPLPQRIADERSQLDLVAPIVAATPEKNRAGCSVTS
jgi:integrase